MAKKKFNNIFADHEPLWAYVKGEGQWNNFLTPDSEYDTWSTNIYGQEVEDLETELQAYLDEAIEFVKEEGKEVEDVADLYKIKDGKKYINFKRKARGGENEPPKIYNITGEEVTGHVKTDPGGGSTLRVRTMIKPYYMPSKKVGKTVVPAIVGLSYMLLAVQIIENKEYVGASGFQDESGGATETPPFDADGTDGDEY